MIYGVFLGGISSRMEMDRPKQYHWKETDYCSYRKFIINDNF